MRSKDVFLAPGFRVVPPPPHFELDHQVYLDEYTLSSSNTASMYGEARTILPRAYVSTSAVILGRVSILPRRFVSTSEAIIDIPIFDPEVDTSGNEL